MDLQETIKAQLEHCDPVKPEILQSTGWIDEGQISNLESIHQEYANLAQLKINSISSLIGSPKYYSRDGDFFSNWYPEAFYAAAWEIEDKILYLAAEQHDKETPVSMVLGAASRRQINALGV
jgi:hypothetical protein